MSDSGVFTLAKYVGNQSHGDEVLDHRVVRVLAHDDAPEVFAVEPSSHAFSLRRS